MKMVMAVVPRDESPQVLEALIQAGFTATYAESRGGLLRQAQYTLFVAVKAHDLERVLDIIRQKCHSPIHLESGEAGSESSSYGLCAPMQASVGGAVVFVWDLERFEVH